MRDKGMQKNKLQSRQFIHTNKDALSRLTNMADSLNWIVAYRSRVNGNKEVPSDQVWFDAWQIIEQIVTLGEAGKLRDAVKQFTAQAVQHPLRMKVIIKRAASKQAMEESVPLLEFPVTPLDIALNIVWDYYFRNQGWTRLKRCPVCQTWFVDTTRNKSMLRCSRECTLRWWDYNQRKKAGHVKSNKGGSRHVKK
jgi:predicted RNA-binding Zn ribbon-like protein